jgi:hypothetical protein
MAPAAAASKDIECQRRFGKVDQYQEYQKSNESESQKGDESGHYCASTFQNGGRNGLTRLIT